MQVSQVFGRERLEVVGAVLSALQRSGKITLLWLLGPEPQARVYRLDGEYYGVFFAGKKNVHVLARVRDGRAEIIEVRTSA